MKRSSSGLAYFNHGSLYIWDQTLSGTREIRSDFTLLTVSGLEKALDCRGEGVHITYSLGVLRGS